MSRVLPFGEKVKELAKARDLAQADLALDAYYASRKRGTKPDTFNKVIQGQRRANEALVEAVAEVLGVPPEVFVEYRLSKLRRSLDESVVGFSEAVSRLELIEAALTVAAGMREERLAEGLVREIEALAQTVQGPSAAPVKGSRAS